MQPGGVGDAVHTCRVSLAPDLGIPPKPPRGQGSAPHGLFWALLGPLQGRAPPEEADLARARVHVHTLCVYMCVHACRLCAQVCMLCVHTFCTCVCTCVLAGHSQVRERPSLGLRLLEDIGAVSEAPHLALLVRPIYRAPHEWLLSPLCTPSWTPRGQRGHARCEWSLS